MDEELTYEEMIKALEFQSMTSVSILSQEDTLAILAMLRRYKAEVDRLTADAENLKRDLDEMREMAERPSPKTQFDQLKDMSVEQFVEWVLYDAPMIARQYTHSEYGLKQWLEREVVCDEPD